MQNKSKLAKLKRMYVKIPSKIVDINLSAQSVSIYLYMASCAEGFNPSIRYIGKKLLMAPGTVIKYVEELENRNIIKRISTGGIKKLNKFSFVDPSQWIDVVTTNE